MLCCIVATIFSHRYSQLTHMFWRWSANLQMLCSKRKDDFFTPWILSHHIRIAKVCTFNDFWGDIILNASLPSIHFQYKNGQSRYFSHSLSRSTTAIKYSGMNTRVTVRSKDPSICHVSMTVHTRDLDKCTSVAYASKFPWVQ